MAAETVAEGKAVTKRKSETKRTAALAPSALLPLGLLAGCGGMEDEADMNGPANTYYAIGLARLAVRKDLQVTIDTIVPWPRKIWY